MKGSICSRFLSVLLSIVLIVSLLPTTTFALTEEDSVVPAKELPYSAEAVDIRISFAPPADPNSTTSSYGSETSTGRGDSTEGDIVIDGLYQDGEAAEGEVSGSSGTGSTVTVPTHEGDKTQSESPTNYDQTTTTTTDRTATATVSKVTVSTSYQNSGDDALDRNGWYFDASGNHGEHFISWTHNVFWHVYNRDGSHALDKNGENWEGAANIVAFDLKNISGKLLSGLYCADLNTSPSNGAYYERVNLEDAVADGYYSVEDAATLRAIMKNGYTLPSDCSEETFDADLNANLAAFKESLILQLDENGKLPGTELTEDAINALSYQQAASATQMAIWSVANRIELGDGQYLTMINAGYSGEQTDENLVCEELCNYLLSLSDDGVTDGEYDETQIINEDKFIDDLELVIGSMVQGNANNSDDDYDNDVYNVGLKFSLVVTPSVDDDLVVKVLNSNGQVVGSARIAGEAQEGEISASTVTENGKTYYVLDGLTLEENSDVSFNLKLEGTQNLKEGVYVFRSLLDEDGQSTSQNFIGMSGGTSDVNVSMDVTLRFSVDEAIVTTERSWHHESGAPDSGTPNTPEEPKDDTPDEDLPDDGKLPEDEPEDDTPDDGKLPEDGPKDDTPDDEKLPEDETSDTDIPDDEIPLAPTLPAESADTPDGAEVTDIPDDDIPLSDLPKTGDTSGVYLTLTLLSACGLLLLLLTGKKRGSV